MNLPMRAPGQYPTHMRGPDGQIYEMPWARSADARVQFQNSLGQHPQHFPSIEDSPEFAEFNKIPAWFTVTVELGGDANAVGSGSVQLRPEPFVCRRCTFATSGDVPPFYTGPSSGSVQGRAVTIEWQDEFTRFLGSRPVLVSALFGDSQGFLDFPRGILLQGRQSLSVNLTRLFWAGDVDAEAATRWDFTFTGISLLPKGVNQSGSAG